MTLTLADDTYADGYNNGYTVGYGDAAHILASTLHLMEDDLDEHRGELTHLADDIDTLKRMLQLAQTDDLE